MEEEEEAEMSNQQEKSQKKNAILVDGVILNGPVADSKSGEKFVEEVSKIIMEEVVKKASDATEKVCEWQSPEQLRTLLDLELKDTGESHPKLLQLCQDVIQFSVKTYHPRFFNQLYAGIDYYSLAARFITEALNPSVYTYEISPVFLLVEEAVLKKMIEYIGWEVGDGIFNPGGSVSNMYAMNLARYKYFPDIKEKGLSGIPQLVLFTSEECHYSVKKAASFLGIGTQNVYFVKSDDRGKMIPEELEKQVQQARNEDLLKRCYSANASYLFQQDKFYDISYDTGDKSIQCSRRADAFKFWMTWKALGTTGLEERVNRALALVRYLVDEIKKREGFQLLLEPEYANICFWYIPPSLRKMEKGHEFWEKLSCVAPIIKERMMKKGSMMVGYQPHRGKVNFFRQVIISPQVIREDMDFLLDEIDSLGQDL
ncbi:acidic amino acid decarboxylase GADL1 isoform X6 [Ahaetulla prasina]|uniref:acidic amino acid decarboxylase GADL1 isoform X6 n=1 Tax=Ahaetulla prasina TaxID=499056 RepID=UPI002647DFBB|nr:acidic amino acid decarboxylase GADL1 isoform X6 [Ahaetulla prasina]